MDNQFNQPGGYPPQMPQGYPQGYGTQNMGPVPGNVPQGYMGYPQQAPYGMQQPDMPQGYGPLGGAYAGGMPQNAGVPQNGSIPQGYADALGQSGYQQPVMYPDYQQPPYSEDGYQHLFNADPSMGMGEQPPSGFPQQVRKPVKPRLRLTPFHVAIILVALGFMVWYLYSQFAPEAARYGYITAGSLDATHAGDCLIVRNEAPYDSEGVTSITYEAEEGSAIIRGADICKVYSSGYSTREMRTLQQYRSEIRDYQKKLIESETAYDARMNRVTADVLTRVKEVRALIGGARGSLSNQEELLREAVEARQKYLNEKYTADQRFSRLNDDETSQSQRIDSWTKKETATTEGIVSFYSDGYEYGLTGNNYTTFEPYEVRAMYNGQKPELTTTQKGKTTIYRMVKDGEWYVLFLSDDTSWNPVNGQTYKLQLERFENTLVDAEVVSFTRSGGELLVRLRVRGSVKPVLYMRTCDAVLGESLTTLMVSERAIHTQDGMTGVVVVEGQTESFIPVNVIRYEDGNAYIQAIQQGLLYENMTVLLF